MDKNQSPADEQLICARGLDIGVKLVLVALIACFAAYLSGALPAAVPLERLPDLWGLSTAQYLERSGMTRGWGWVAMLGHGDFLSLASIAFLLSVSTLCLLLLLPVYAARRDWTFFSIVLIEIGVLVLAASGVLAAGH